MNFAAAGKGALSVLVALAAGAALAQQPSVDPQEQKVMDAMKALGAKPIHTGTPQEVRKGVTPKDAVLKVLKDEGKSVEPEKVAKVEDKQIDGGKGKIHARIYTPQGVGPFPVVLYFHGGGFVIADPDVYDASGRALANDSGAMVVSIDYRRAPEHPYPAALDDGTAAFKYLLKHAKELNGDPGRIAVAGESAGGNLAIGVALRQKKSGGPSPVFALLVYPFVSNDLSTPSHVANGQGNYILGNEDIAWFWKYTFGKDWKKLHDPMALPIYATTAQLKGFPPSLVITAGLDPLKDEGEKFAQMLKDAGVKVETKNYDGVTHEFFSMGPAVDKAKQAEQDAGDALRAAFGSGAAGGAAKSPGR